MRRAAGVLPVALAALLALAAGAARAGEGAIAPPGPRDRCPVCGMFVAPFPSWWAEVVLADGSREVFDGVKDLVRYLGDRKRYAPAREHLAVVRIRVLDYYGLQPLPAEEAFFVAGSDVLGPMGREFVPLRTQAEAEEFLRDHRGEAILRFADLPGRRPE